MTGVELDKTRFVPSLWPRGPWWTRPWWQLVLWLLCNSRQFDCWSRTPLCPGCPCLDSLLSSSAAWVKVVSKQEKLIPRQLWAGILWPTTRSDESQESLVRSFSERVDLVRLTWSDVMHYILSLYSLYFWLKLFKMILRKWIDKVFAQSSIIIIIINLFCDWCRPHCNAVCLIGNRNGVHLCTQLTLHRRWQKKQQEQKFTRFIKVRNYDLIWDLKQQKQKSKLR